jgi:hypothetical protein
VGTAGNFAKAMDAAARHNPDVTRKTIQPCFEKHMLPCCAFVRICKFKSGLWVSKQAVGAAWSFWQITDVSSLLNGASHFRECLPGGGCLTGGPCASGGQLGPLNNHICLVLNLQSGRDTTCPPRRSSKCGCRCEHR